MTSSIASLLMVFALWLSMAIFCCAGTKQNYSERSVSETPSNTSTRDPKESAKGLISFDYKWSKGGFESIMLVDFTFTNRSSYAAKDITVTCTHYAPSGTEIDSNTRTIYELIPANSKKIVKRFNMGFIHSQATSTICKIDDLKIE